MIFENQFEKGNIFGVFKIILKEKYFVFLIILKVEFFKNYFEEKDSVA